MLVDKLMTMKPWENGLTFYLTVFGRRIGIRLFTYSWDEGCKIVYDITWVSRKGEWREAIRIYEDGFLSPRFVLSMHRDQKVIEYVFTPPIQRTK